MALQLRLSATVRNARLDQIETIIGTLPTLQIWSGTAPLNLSTTPGGSILVTMNLPSDWLGAASNGAKSKLGTWTGQGTAAAGAGVDATFFRILSSGAVVHMQGTVGETADTPDMILDNKNIAQNQTVTVTTFTLTDGNIEG